MKKYALMLLVVLAFHTVGWGSVVGLVSPGANLIPNSSLRVRPSMHMSSSLPSSVRLNLHGGLNSCTTVGLNRMLTSCSTPIRSAALCRTPNLRLGVHSIPNLTPNLYPAVFSGLGGNVNVDVSQISHINTPSNGGTSGGTVVWGTSNSSSSSSQSP
ncbi:MAG: hypothetical protein JW741_03870 [Sedimentisphaerales bacterium]|nr:hypothetical protein [Sedimentisphaerales bacterium]